jgi:putative membrane protein
MNLNSVRMVAIAATVILLPTVLIAQSDPSAPPGSIPGSISYPQSPQNINSPSGGMGTNTPLGSQTSPSSTMRDTLGAPGQTGQQMLDKQFLKNAALGGIADVRLSMLAVEKGGPEVKELAQRMVDDHTSINKDMATVADAVGVMLPKKISKDDQAEYDKLQGLSGKDFDAEYLTFMAKSHYEDLHAFHMEASVAADPGLQTEVVKAMGMMHDHIGMIAKLAKEEGVTLPPRPARPGPPPAAKQ